MAEDQESPEVTLERTISRVTDDNWANQVPVDSGVLGARPHYIDLVHRSGTKFSFIELKVRSNTALSAAFQIVKYGLAYAFSRDQAEVLGYNVEAKELLRASGIDLCVLAPDGFYPEEAGWLNHLEDILDKALERFASTLPGLEIPMRFRFDAFPEWFAWAPRGHRAEVAEMNALYALHQRLPAVRV